MRFANLFAGFYFLVLFNCNAQNNEELEEVIVTDNNDLRDVERRMSKINLNTIKELPSLLGDADRLLYFLSR